MIPSPMFSGSRKEGIYQVRQEGTERSSPGSCILGALQYPSTRIFESLARWQLSSLSKDSHSSNHGNILLR